jgi:hypothetical protein
MDSERGAARENRFSKVNVGLAVMIAVVASALLYDRAYDWIIERPPWLIAIGVFVGIPVLGFATVSAWESRSDSLPWLICLSLIVLGMVGRAAVDAGELHSTDCWEVPNRADTYACAPGSEPNQYPPGADPGRFCEKVGDSSTGATVWRCEAT